MIRQAILPSLLFLSTSYSHIQAEENSRTPRIPPTHAELTKKKADLAQKKAVRVANSEKPLAVTKKRSLIGNSTLLANGNYWTLVPRGAVIHIPSRYKDKVVSKPIGRLLEWKKFLRQNQGWLQTHAVTMKQAQGKEPIKEKTQKAYQSIGKVVVATCANGPISVAKKPATAVQPTRASKDSKSP
ncbi:MAG: hypothetical protein AB8F34_06680 [Akkermansiaceae bacterium]